MTNQYKFIPRGDPPSPENILRFFYNCALAILAAAIILFVFGKPGWRLNVLLYSAGLILLVYIIVSTGRYMLNITIDKATHQLRLNYITVKGKEGTLTIDIDKAKYRYKLSISHARFPYWILTIKDGKTKIKLCESRSSSKTQANGFSKAQLDEIIQVITSPID